MYPLWFEWTWRGAIRAHEKNSKYFKNATAVESRVYEDSIDYSDLHSNIQSEVP